MTKVGSKVRSLNASVTRRTRGWRLLAAVVGLVFAAPLAYLVVRSVQLGADFRSVVFSDRTLGPLTRSVTLAIAVTLGCIVVGTGLAWLVQRTTIPGRRFWAIVAPLPLVIPSFVFAASIRHAFGPGGLVGAIPRFEGFSGAFLTLVALSYPYVYLPVASRLRRISPSLEEGARMLGSSSWRTFRTVVIPQTRGAIAAGGLLVFLYVLSDFGAVSIMRYDTLTRAIYSARLSDQPTAVSLGLMLALLAVAVGVAERWFRSDLDDGRPLVGEPRIYALGRTAPVAVTAVALIATIALIAPVAVFLFWWIGGVSAPAAGYGGVVSMLSQLGRPAFNTAVAGVIAAVVAAVVVFPVAYAKRRLGVRVAELSSAVVIGSFALPGLVVALAIAFWVIQAPWAWLYQSFPVLILGYVVHFGAQSLRSSQAALDALSSRYDEVAQTLGADQRRRLATIDLPLVLPGVGAGAGLVMLSVMKELPATLLLAPIGFETLATRIWNASEDGFLADVGVASLALIVVSALLTWTLVLRSTATEQ
ncbi:MAG TPA: iron ABC transporter permease [Actinobacteria bacterium]|nr:iron ABC transporter permease [Actinomycetota bacterium]